MIKNIAYKHGGHIARRIFIDMIERVQMRATKMIQKLREISYECV